MLREQNSQGQWVEVQVDAQGCGIGIVLTELCLVDQEIYTKDNRNKAENLLRAAGTTLHEPCKKLVGLTMAADPPKGHVYFSAAMRNGYDRLLIDQTCGKMKETKKYDQYKNATITHYTWDKQVKFNDYEAALARQKYDIVTAEIHDCVGYGKCQAYMRNWYFCDR